MSNTKLTTKQSSKTEHIAFSNYIVIEICTDAFRSHALDESEFVYLGAFLGKEEGLTLCAQAEIGIQARGQREGDEWQGSQIAQVSNTSWQQSHMDGKQNQETTN